MHTYLLLHRTGLAAAFSDDDYGDFCWRTLEEQEGIDLTRSRRPHCGASRVHFRWWRSAQSASTQPRVIPFKACRVLGWITAR